MEQRVRQVLEGKQALFDGLLVNDADRVEIEVGQATFLDRLRTVLE